MDVKSSHNLIFNSSAFKLEKNKGIVKASLNNKINKIEIEKKNIIALNKKKMNTKKNKKKKIFQFIMIMN